MMKLKMNLMALYENITLLAEVKKAFRLDGLTTK